MVGTNSLKGVREGLNSTLKVTVISLDWFVCRAVLIRLRRGYLTKAGFRTRENFSLNVVPKGWRVKSAASYAHQVLELFQ